MTINGTIKPISRQEKKNYIIWNMLELEKLGKGKKTKYPFIGSELTFDLDGDRRFDKPKSF
tara:strand:+ start:120 stop:302 length:183 start_codon:yes stop_codon:yes gene_type:complete